jgi:hypothetical protein
VNSTDQGILKAEAEVHKVHQSLILMQMVYLIVLTTVLTHPTQVRKMWMETVLVMLVITVLRPLIQIRVTWMKTVWVMSVMMWTIVIHKRTNPNLTHFF